MTDTTSGVPSDDIQWVHGDAPAGSRSRRAKGERRQQQVAQAAADIVLEQGPSAVTHRAVAAKARASLSATTYYFKDLSDLFDAAGEILSRAWDERVEAIRHEAETTTVGDIDAVASLLVRVAVPADHTNGIRGFYEALVQVGRTGRLADALLRLRPGAEHIVTELMDKLLPDAKVDARQVLVVIDGGAIGALASGTEPVAHATDMLAQYLS